MCVAVATNYLLIFTTTLQWPCCPERSNVSGETMGILAEEIFLLCGSRAAAPCALGAARASSISAVTRLCFSSDLIRKERCRIASAHVRRRFHSVLEQRRVSRSRDAKCRRDIVVES